MDIAARPQAYEAPLDLCKKLEGVNKVVVAIHGIGSQTRSSTIRYVVRQFGDRCPVKLPLMPLGFFHIGPGVDSVVSRMPPNFDPDLARIGFVEIFWANIPRGVVDSKDTLEETKAWARTIVSQAESLYASKAQSGPKLWPKDFALAGGVVEEIVETIGVLENLCTLAEKAGLFTFDLAGLLRDYVDDVQVVTEFEQYRRDILLCFHKSMAHVAKVFRECGKPVPEIFIVAHSEGTVVSFLGLLEAIAGLTIADPLAKPGQPTTVDTSWIANVRGYMTIGSPIDKHLLLWPRLWNHVNGKLGGKHDADQVAQLLRLWRPDRLRARYRAGIPPGRKVQCLRVRSPARLRLQSLSTAGQGAQRLLDRRGRVRPLHRRCGESARHSVAQSAAATEDQARVAGHQPGPALPARIPGPRGRDVCVVQGRVELLLQTSRCWGK